LKVILSPRLYQEKTIFENWINLIFNTYLTIKIVPRLAVATRCVTHPISDLPLKNENTRDVIGRQPWISVYSNTGRGIDISFIEYPIRMHLFLNSRGEITILTSYIKFH
jgi:hypothetical protein